MKLQIILLLLVFNSCNKEKLDSVFTEHGQSLRTTDFEPVLPFNFLNEVKFDIFLTGEVHGIAENYAVRRSLIKKLTRDKGISILVIEFPLSSSRMIQNYLNTGDETDLVFIYSNLKSTSEYTQEGIDFFRWLKSYNSMLPSYKKLQLIGVDIEHQPTVTKYYISRLLANKTIPVNIETNIRRLIKENLSTELLMTIQKDMAANDADYKLLFQSDFTVFNLIVKNALVRFQYGSNSQLFDEAREKAMLDTWIQLLPDQSSGPVYGHFGAAHLTTYTITQDRLALLLKKNNVTKSLVQVSMPFIYKNASYRNPQGAQVSLDVITNPIWLNQVEEQYYFYDFSTLTAKEAKYLGWPFSKAIFGSPPESGIMTDYFKYFFLINKGKACTTFQQ